MQQWQVIQRRAMHGIHAAYSSQENHTEQLHSAATECRIAVTDCRMAATGYRMATRLHYVIGITLLLVY